MNIQNLDPNVWRVIAIHCPIRTAVHLSSTCSYLHERLRADVSCRCAEWLAVSPDERLIRAVECEDQYLVAPLLTWATCKGWALYRAYYAVAVATMDRVTANTILFTGEDVANGKYEASGENVTSKVSSPDLVNTASTMHKIIDILCESPIPMTSAKDLIGGRVMLQYSQAEISSYANFVAALRVYDTYDPVTIPKIPLAAIYDAAAHGDVVALRSMEQILGTSVTANILPIFRYASQYGQTCVLDWGIRSIFNIIIECSVRCAASAAAGGSVEALQWYREHPTAVDRNLYLTAALHGRVNVLNYLHATKVGHVNTRELCVLAVTHGHLEVLQWAHQHGYLCRRARLILLAKKTSWPNRAEIIEWLEKVD